MAVDSSGNVYYSGFFRDTVDFEPDNNLSYNLIGGPLVNLDVDDGFLAKPDSSGNFLWAKKLGNDGDDNIYDMSIDSKGNICVSGSFEGLVDFDLDSLQTHFLIGVDDDYNSFISTYDVLGNFKWAKVNVGGYSSCLGISHDLDGNVITTSFGLTQGNSVMKYDSVGTLIWQKDIGDDSNVASKVTINRFGNIFIIGLIKAIENPYTSILGHPTGRLLLARPGYPINHKKGIDACAANKLSVELNAHPYRLDIDWRWIWYCLEKNVKISINPDAHHREGFHDMYFGVCAARKGMLSKEFCLNALNLEDLKEKFKK